MALLIAAAILIIGFLANLLFKKTGWPEILLLIIIGIIIGPVLNLLPQESFLPALPLISTFTLLMVLFRGGMELNISEVVSGSARGLLQAGLYFALGVLFVAAFLHFVLGWTLIESLMLGSILSQTGEVVIIPLAKKLRLKPQTVILLSLEAVITSIFNIVFFFAFLSAQTLGIFNFTGALIQIGLSFLVGLAIGTGMGVIWLKALFYIGKEELAYMVTIGYIFLAYVITELLSGSGPLAVLALGLVLGNEREFLRRLRLGRVSAAYAEVKNYLMRFQFEISFILRAFFFVLLGLMFDLSQSSVVSMLSYGLPILAILLVTRYLVASASTWRSPMAEEKRPIVAMCALGMTPVLLSFIALQYNLPRAPLYLLIVTNVIIATNIITSAAALTRAKTKYDQYE
jgi:cell volume regulation protein A